MTESTSAAGPLDTATSNPGATLEETMRGFLSEANDFNHFDVPDEVRQTLSNASSNISSAFNDAAVARAKAQQISADDTIYPDGRRRMAGEAVEEGRSKSQTKLDSAEAQLRIGEAVAFEAARPKVPHSQGAEARMDARMLLDSAFKASEPGRLNDAVQALAGRQDAVGALVTSSWLDDYATAHNIPRQLMDPLKTQIRHFAMEAAAKSGDRQRSAAAKAYIGIGKLRQAHVTAVNAARMMLT